MDMTATTAMPEAVRTGLARSLQVGTQVVGTQGVVSRFPPKWMAGVVLGPHVVSMTGIAGSHMSKGHKTAASRTRCGSSVALLLLRQVGRRWE